MISLLIPTRKRPIRLGATITSALATCLRPHELEILCYIADDDDSYTSMKWEAFPGLKIVNGPRLIFSDLWNALLPHATGDIFMLCADDVIFRTPGWDFEVDKTFARVPDKILLAYCDDGGPNGKKFASLPFVSRRWTEVVGYFTGPGFTADYSDTWPNDVAEMIGRKKLIPDVLIEHMHHVWGKAPVDQTYQENQDRWLRDRPDLHYANRLNERIRDAEKLRAAMQ